MRSLEQSCRAVAESGVSLVESLIDLFNGKGNL